MERTPLEQWIGSKITGDRDIGGALTRDQIDQYQLKKLQETFELAKNKSNFYRRHLAGVNNICELEDLKEIPFTTPDDIRANPLQLLCVSQSEINRVVTLQSSGTTGLPKRLFFTRDDHELTVDFFHYGMSTLVSPGDRVLILLPGELPDSVGDLLMRGLKRLGVVGIPHGPVRDPGQTLKVIIREKVDCLVGIPIQVLSLARYINNQGMRKTIKLKSVLLSTDYVPSSIVRELENSWQCKVYTHYGMPEMGLGGGVDCQSLSGYHLREADLYFEVVNPITGEPVPDGVFGEVVFTTLTRKGMPLIRYRTGDISRFIPEPCSCGTILRKMDWVKSRISGQVQLTAGGKINIAELDEVIFPLPGILDFTVSLHWEDGKDVLYIQVNQTRIDLDIKDLIHSALMEIPIINEADQKDNLLIKSFVSTSGIFINSGSYKRKIIDERKIIQRSGVM